MFFIASWAVHLIKLYFSLTAPVKDYVAVSGGNPEVSIIVPVVDEDKELWKNVLNRLVSSEGIVPEIIVVPNGSNAVEEAKIAEEMGLKVVRCEKAGKREAIECGIEHATKPYTVILDSDTLVFQDSIRKLIEVFLVDSKVGGATPLHYIFNLNSVWARISNWMEDIRFNEVVAGQSRFGAVSCLPGRLLAIRSNLLKQAVPELVNETFLGSKCISGDDRFLTSWLLKNGWETRFVESSVVATHAPETFKGFVKQRLRWSRTSLRETILSLSWIFNHPFTALTTLSTVVFRWWFFGIIVFAILAWAGVIDRVHYVNLDLLAVVIFSAFGFLLSGMLRQARHLIMNPDDWYLLPVFLFVTTFVLTPVEWYGNLTLKESDWMTRKVD